MTYSRAFVSRIADAVIEECCLNATCRDVVDAIILAHYASKAKPGYNRARFALLPKHERKFSAMLRTMWGKQRRQVLANMRRSPKAVRTKSIIDQWLYGKSDYIDQLSGEARALLLAVLTEAAQNELDHWAMEIEFDASAEWVTSWLGDYVFKFAKELEDVSQDELRRMLQEGIDQGETISQLAERVQTVYDGWDEMRAELIARTETLRASNEGALDSYRQSGVVTQIMWVATEGACDWCQDLNNEVIDLDTPFLEDGDVFTVGSEHGEVSMDIDYGNVDCPPLHPNCRCTIIPYYED